MKTQEQRIQDVRQKIARVRAKLADDQEMIDWMEKRYGKQDPRVIKAKKQHAQKVAELDRCEKDLNEAERDEKSSARIRQNFTKPEAGA